MKLCQICQQRLASQMDWRYLIKNNEQLPFCENCLNDDELIQTYHKEYIELNYYHHRHFLSAILQKLYNLQKATIFTVGYSRDTLNLYDETYAICQLLTKNCYSLTLTKLPNDKFINDIHAMTYKKPLYVVSYNGLPNSIEKILENIPYRHISLL